jgi:hypothetical protein
MFDVELGVLIGFFAKNLVWHLPILFIIFETVF